MSNVKIGCSIGDANTGTSTFFLNASTGNNDGTLNARISSLDGVLDLVLSETLLDRSFNGLYMV